MTFRFLHLADLHLETHFGGRARAKERLRKATLEAFERAVDFALKERLHAVLVAGDMFDDQLLSLRTELTIVRQIERLAQAGTWFIAVCGNHDSGGASKRMARLGVCRDETRNEPWRKRIVIFRKPQPELIVVDDREGTEVGVVIGAGHATEREERNLAADFIKLDTELPVVGLLHTQVESARSGELHDRYAPSTPRDYAHQGYVYWALGHIHLRQRALADHPAWYAGNLQGRNARETGAKGGLVVEAEPKTPVQEPQFQAFARLRWERERVAGLEHIETTSSLINELAERLRELAERFEEELIPVLELTGPCPLASTLKGAETREQLEEELIELTGFTDIQIRLNGLHRPRDLDAMRRTPTVLGKALELIDGARFDTELLERIAPEVLAGLQPNTRSDQTDALDAEEKVKYLRSLLEGLEHELVDRTLVEDAQ